MQPSRVLVTQSVCDQANPESMCLCGSRAGEKWFFDFNCWLDAKNGMSATRPPSKFKAATKGGVSNYRWEGSQTAGGRAG